MPPLHTLVPAFVFLPHKVALLAFNAVSFPLEAALLRAFTAEHPVLGAATAAARRAVAAADGPGKFVTDSGGSSSGGDGKNRSRGWGAEKLRALLAPWQAFRRQTARSSLACSHPTPFASRAPAVRCPTQSIHRILISSLRRSFFRPSQLSSSISRFYHWGSSLFRTCSGPGFRPEEYPSSGARVSVRLVCPPQSRSCD